LRVLTTVRFPVIQFNPVQHPFVTFGIVPKAARQRSLSKLGFCAMECSEVAIGEIAPARSEIRPA
jgi:hypothetical protein